jgi:hypothetical protein
MQCYLLRPPKSERLRAEEDPPQRREYIDCPLTREHLACVRPIGPLSLQVKHNKRDEWIIKVWTAESVFHKELIAELGRRGFTGFRTKPAKVRFRDGGISEEYYELDIVGWGGHARPESGIRLIEECPGCRGRKYSDVEEAEQLIDWTQWSRDDFFFVWPLPFTFITERVADTLSALKVKSYTIESLQWMEVRNMVQRMYPPSGYATSRISCTKPPDIVIKYGRPLGLD